MAKDFKASQVRTSKIVVSGTESGKPALLIYSASDASNFSGGFQGDMLTNVGPEVYLFVSGNNSSLASGQRSNVTLFGGDVVVSGTFYAEKMVSEVSTTTDSDHYISGALFVNAGDNGAKPSSRSGWGDGNFTNVDLAVVLPAATGEGGIAFDYDEIDGVSDAVLFETNGFLTISGSKGVVFNERNLDGKNLDTFFFVSGTIGSQDGTTRGVALFGGDLRTSGSLSVSRSAFIDQQLNVGDRSNFTGSVYMGNSDNYVANKLIHEGDTDTYLEFNTDWVKLMTAGDHASGGTSISVRTISGIGSRKIELNAEKSDVDTTIHAKSPGKALFHSIGQSEYERVLILSGGAAGSSDESEGSDVAFYVSGSKGSAGTQRRGAALFGGDVSISGSVNQGRQNIASNDSLATGWQNKATGNFSAVQGYLTTASAHYSHAEGMITTAAGMGSHAEGRGSRAAGSFSHAEGLLATSSGGYSHAEGQRTLALGDYSHAEGYMATSSGDFSHAQGKYTEAIGNYSFAGGLNTIASGTSQSVFGKFNQQENTDSLFIVGGGTDDDERKDNFIVNQSEVMVGSGSIGADTYLFVSGALSSRGTSTKGTATFGGDVLISGTLTSIGTPLVDVSGTPSNNQLAVWLDSNTIEGDSSFTWNGSQLHLTGAVSQGRHTQASGQYSHAEGYYTTASNYYAHAEGEETIASGQSSHAEGKYTKATNSESHAEGFGSLASGIGAHAEGSYTTASANSAHSEGAYSVASAVASHAEGYGTKASSLYAHSEGYFTTASSNYSHAEGFKSLASGAGAHAEGAQTTASNSYSHAEGYKTQATGQGSHAEGSSTVAQGLYSHAEGYETLAQGLYSHAKGRDTAAIGSYSSAGGRGTIASGSSQTTIGKYNQQGNDESLFIIGGGASVSDRKDVVLVNNDTILLGSGSLGSDVFLFLSGSERDPGSSNPEMIVLGGNTLVSGTLYGGVNSNVSPSRNLLDLEANQIVLQGGGITADLISDINGADICVFISGSRGSRGTSVRGTAVVGGDFHVSGNITGGGILDGAGATNRFALWHDGNTLTHASALVWEPDTGPSGQVRLQGAVITDNAEVTGTLDVVGRTTLTGSVSFMSDANITGNLTVLGPTSTTDKIIISTISGIMDLAGATLTINDGSTSRVLTFAMSASTDDEISVSSVGDIADFADNIETAINGSNGGSVNITASSPANDVILSHDSGGTITISFAQLAASADPASKMTHQSAGGSDFRVGTLNRTHAIFTDGKNDRVLILSGGAPSSDNEAAGSDIAFYVSGTIGSEGTSVRGASLFGGDLIVSGGVGIGAGATGYNDSANGLIVYKAGNGGITIAGGASDYGSIYFADGSGASSNHQGAVQYHHGTDKLYLGAGGTDNHITLDSAGHLGVGTTSPQSKLDVEGGVSIGSGYAGTSAAPANSLIIEEHVGIGTTTPDAYNDSADGLVVYRAGNGGITIAGGVNDYGTLYFADATSGDGSHAGAVQYHHQTDKLFFGTAGNDNRVTIDSSGNVGIGTTSPLHALTVEGAVSASLGITGSLTKLADGTSYIRAGSNITVTSASNGSVTVSATAGGNIGSAEDGDYSDGLFSSFTSSTTIGTAIDKINEVLKYLAPSPAANVTDLNANAAKGTVAFLSFGSSSGNNPTGYTVVTDDATRSANGNSLSTVDIDGSYAVATGSSGDLRLAVYNAGTTISGIINSKVLQSDYNSGAIINHVADSFGDADKGTLTLEVNGSDIVTVDLTNETVGVGVPGSGTGTHYGAGVHSATGITHLSQTGSARTQGDAEFPVFQHRTGKFTVSSNSQRKGYNYAKLKHAVGSSTHTSNFVEWVFDQDGTDASAPISANDSGFSFDALQGGTNRFDLSGVRYAVTSSGEYKSRIENYYKHVYATNAISTAITNVSIASTTPAAVPVLAGNDHTKSIHVTSSFDTNVTSILGGTLTGDISVVHPTKTGLSFAGSTNSGRLLIHSASVTPTNTSETFDHEKFRIQSGSYVNQSDITGGGNTWDSSIHMQTGNGGHSDGLQFYNGVLKSPTQTLNGGDFRSVGDGGGYFGSGLSYDGNPNYSGESGLRTFYRKIQNTSGSPIRDFRIQLNAGNTTIPTIVSQGTSLDTQKIKIFARLPSEPDSSWVDLGTHFMYHTTSNRSGGRANATLNTGGSPINYFTFGTGSVANNDYFVIKIEADATLTRDIGGITFVMPGIGGSPSAAPDVSTLNTENGTGVSGKLSFGSSKSIATYNNVSAGAPDFEGAVDINEAFTITGKRYGIFDKTVAITGSINYDVSANGNSYPADAFGGGNAHKGTLKLEVNGAEVHSIDLTKLGLAGKQIAGGSDAGFLNLSTAQNATGSNGIVADYTKFWRTGQFAVGVGMQVNGKNYARVVHSIDGTDEETNYVEWVNDADGSSLSLSNTLFDTFGESNKLYYQSGVKYFIEPTGSFKTQASHAYSNTYSADADAVSITNVSNLDAATFTQITGSGITNGHASSHQMALPDLDVGVSSPHLLPVFITGTMGFSQSTSLPGTAPIGGTSYSAAAKFDVKHPLNGTQTSGNVYVGGNSSKKFLVFSASIGDTNEYTTERFGREDYRIVSGNFITQNSITSGKWDSTKDMNDASNTNYYNGLLVYNGNLISPANSNLLGAGDFRSHFDHGASDLISPLSNVNYSDASLPVVSSSHRTYFRHFENNTANNLQRAQVTLYGSANIVGKSGAQSGSLGSDTNIHLEAKVPGKTGWLDLGKATEGSGNITDGDGGRVTGDTTVDLSGALTTATWNGQVCNGSEVGAEKIIIKITAHKNWTGYINRIDIGHFV